MNTRNVACIAILLCGLRPTLVRAGEEPASPIFLVGVGDSLTHGTMDATNNFVATANAYLARVFYSMRLARPTHFVQPFLNFQENRFDPFAIPTNLGVDGADVFSLEGLEYGKRVGSAVDAPSTSLLADQPWPIGDKYDKVLYPLNLVTGEPTSQVDAAAWLLNAWGPFLGMDRAAVVLWIGNNDASTAALGTGGRNPVYQPIPLFQIAPEIDPDAFWLLLIGAIFEEISFEPYSLPALERNLTDLDDFIAQYGNVLTRLQVETASSSLDIDFFALTLPYYSAVGYLMDSDDLEHYLRKIDPNYMVPPSFQRVSLPDVPLSGDRISLLTFGFMYALLDTGYSIAHVNSILEVNGQQQDGLVLSESEQAFIMERIDGFNDAIKSLAAAHGDKVHVIDVGRDLNDALLGKTAVAVGGRALSRKWMRGSAFTFDGVHPGYTGQTFIANSVLREIQTTLGLAVPLYDLDEAFASDPYVDRDGDGWAPGPSWTAPGITELLHFFKDPDDGSPAIGPELPDDFWKRISDILLSQIAEIPAVLAEAEAAGIPIERRQ